MSELCHKLQFGNADDLDVWLLWAAAEYGLGTRDLRVFDVREPYTGRGSGTLWDHLKLAFRHQQSLLRDHGGYAALDSGDWSDLSTQFLGMTESTLVTAQVAYVYPRLAELAQARGDHAFAAELRDAGTPRPAHDPRTVDAARLVRARIRRPARARHRSDLRGAAAVGDPRRGTELRPGANAGGERPPLPHRRRRAGRGPRSGPDRVRTVTRGGRPGGHRADTSAGGTRLGRRRLPGRQLVRRQRLADVGARVTLRPRARGPRRMRSPSSRATRSQHTPRRIRVTGTGSSPSTTSAMRRIRRRRRSAASA